jgi:uncharacterized membrane protein YfcA
LDKLKTLNNTVTGTTVVTSTEILQSETTAEVLSPYSQATPAEVSKLDKLLAKEATHFQWGKHLVCLILLVSNVLVSLLRGSKKSKSIIGINPCDVVGWLFVVIFVGVCATCTIYGIKTVNKEQTLKKKVGRGMVKGDVKFERKIVTKLVIFALLGGWVSGALGLGGGAIFNPLLLSMGVPPSVSSSTGMYMILFSTAGSSITYLVFGTLNVPFALWIGCWCAVASLVGLYLLNKVMKKFDRQSPVVFLLAFVLGLSALLVPVFAVVQLRGKSDIMAFKSIC